MFRHSLGGISPFFGFDSAMAANWILSVARTPFNSSSFLRRELSEFVYMHLRLFNFEGFLSRVQFFLCRFLGACWDLEVDGLSVPPVSFLNLVIVGPLN